MDAIMALLTKTLLQVWTTFLHNWPFLIVSIVIAVILKLYMDPQKVGAFLLRHRRAGIVGATAAAVGTPLCSCGTTAVILGMMASTLPWAPIIAFMVASPLTSPEELAYSAGLFGWPFAIAFFVSSILLGLLGGVVASVLENRGWFTNQARYSTPKVPANSKETCSCKSEPEPACACSANTPRLPAALTNVRPPSGRYANRKPAPALGGATLTLATAPCACDAMTVVPAAPVRSIQLNLGSLFSPTSKLRTTFSLFMKESFQVGSRLLPMFFGFAFIGYFLNNIIPTAWVSAIFGPGNVYSVPLAATLGLPLYINTEASLPLVRALIDGGMSQGAALAFLITGAGTSFGAVMGALAIAKWRVIALVVSILWAGSIILGSLYNFLLAAGIV